MTILTYSVSMSLNGTLVPSLEKQRRIGEGISSIRDKIRLEQSYLNILNSHKSYLLSKMFI